MDDATGDDALRALRATDPADGTHAPAALRDRVSAIPDGVPAARRSARRWLAPVAAASLVVAMIGGGYLWGTGRIAPAPELPSVAVETATPERPGEPIALGGGGGGSLQAQAQPHVGISLPGMEVGGNTSHQRFTLPAFETVSGEADVYALDGGAQYSAEDAARMAAALGVTGEVRTGDSGGWAVGDSGQALSGEPAPGALFTLLPWGDAYFRGAAAAPVSACEELATALHGRNEGGFGAEMIRCMAETPLPTDDAVQDAAELFLAAIGIDASATRITTQPDESGREITAFAAVIVADNVTEITARITVSAEGITTASGPIGEIVSLGAYPIVSPAEGAGRLSDPAYAARRVVGTESVLTPSGAPTAPPAAPAPGSLIPWRIAEREIVSARLGLALVGADGHDYLVPAYEFTAADGSVWSVLALAEEVLATGD